MASTLPKVVTITGGSGGFVVLRGLREYPLEITAISTVFDSGGSTGILRDQYGALPQGDVRRCLLALIPDSRSDWRKFLMHRFGKDDTLLPNQSFGNLMLLVAEREWGRNDAAAHLARLMNARGNVLPVSVDTAHLMAELEGGETIATESAIDTRNILSDDRKIVRVWLDRPATTTREVVEAIAGADFLVIGPGDLYTSIVPSLLVGGVTKAINESKGKLIYVANIMTKGAETRGYAISDFLEVLAKYGIGRQWNALVLHEGELPIQLLEEYRKERAEPVACTDACRTKLDSVVKQVILKDLLSRTGCERGLIRHSSKRLGRTLMDFIEGRSV